jgi:hypothetical protein
MSERMLEDKFRGLCAGILSPARTDRLIDLCRGADKLADAGDIGRGGGGA